MDQDKYEEFVGKIETLTHDQLLNLQFLLWVEEVERHMQMRDEK